MGCFQQALVRILAIVPAVAAVVFSSAVRLDENTSFAFLFRKDAGQVLDEITGLKACRFARRELGPALPMATGRAGTAFGAIPRSTPTYSGTGFRFDQDDIGCLSRMTKTGPAFAAGATLAVDCVG